MPIIGAFWCQAHTTSYFCLYIKLHTILTVSNSKMLLYLSRCHGLNNSYPVLHNLLNVIPDGNEVCGETFTELGFNFTGILEDAICSQIDML